MSKIAEHKALEVYPILFSERNGYDNTFKDRRESYIKGYDQAMKDMENLQEDAKCQEETEEVTLAKLNATTQYNQGLKDGYDQALQDFMEKAERFIEDTQIENFICRDDGIYFDNERFIEQFKNYIQDE